MAAPVASAHQSPTGIRIKEGYRALITFASEPTIRLWVISVKPPGVTNGEKIRQTTQENLLRHTFAPHAINEYMDSTFKFAYDPAVIDTLGDMVGTEDTVTIQFPDGTTYADFGYLQQCEFDELQHGIRPEGTGSIVWTGTDPDDSEDEQWPTIVSAEGT